MTKEEFYRDLSNYVYVNNDVYCLDYNNPRTLNFGLKINDRTWTKNLGFTSRDYEQLPTYRGFISEPGHGDDYQQTVGDMWNIYHRVNWQPKEGQWPTIHKLLSHLYGKNAVEEDQLEAIYDYHTIMMKWPKEKLYARVLYSHTQGTAKSALAVLESYIFEKNYVKLRADQFEEKYNSIWADRLLIHLDEPAFNQPKKMSRDIRDYITTPRISVRRMNTDAAESLFHGKFLITTNDTNFMSFEDSDRRYWIREVPAIPEEDLDPNFMHKIEKEVDSYIHFLLNREMQWPQKVDGTFWLPRTILKTNGNAKLVGDNESDELQIMKEFFEDWFLKDRKREVCCTTLSDLMDQIKWQGRSKPGRTAVKIYLREKLGAGLPTRTTRVGKDEHYIISASEKELLPGKYIRIYRKNFDLDFDIFDPKSLESLNL